MVENAPLNGGSHLVLVPVIISDRLMPAQPDLLPDRYLLTDNLGRCRQTDTSAHLAADQPIQHFDDMLRLAARADLDGERLSAVHVNDVSARNFCPLLSWSWTNPGSTLHSGVGAGSAPVAGPPSCAALAACCEASGRLRCTAGKRRFGLHISPIDVTSHGLAGSRNEHASQRSRACAVEAQCEDHVG